MPQPASAIKKNDNVIVISGRDAGKRGRVLRVVPDKRRVIVEGVNFIKRHTRPDPRRNVKGGIVQLVCPECGARTRVGRRLLDDGRRVRFCVKCKGVVDK